MIEEAKDKQRKVNVKKGKEKRMDSAGPTAGEWQDSDSPQEHVATSKRQRKASQKYLEAIEIEKESADERAAKKVRAQNKKTTKKRASEAREEIRRRIL